MLFHATLVRVTRLAAEDLHVLPMVPSASSTLQKLHARSTGNLTWFATLVTCSKCFAAVAQLYTLQLTPGTLSSGGGGCLKWMSG